MADNPAGDAFQQVLDSMSQMTKAWQDVVTAQIKDQLANVTAVAELAKSLGTPSEDVRSAIDKAVELQKQQMADVAEKIKALTTFPKADES